MTRAEIVALVDRCLDALARRDTAAVAAEHAESCVLESPTAGGSVTGRAAVASVYQIWLEGFPNLAITRETLIVEADRFAQHFTLSGTDMGGFLGLAPTGRTFRVPVVWLGRVSGGQIVHSQPVYDFSGVLIQIGVLKAKPA